MGQNIFSEKFIPIRISRMTGRDLKKPPFCAEKWVLGVCWGSVVQLAVGEYPPITNRLRPKGTLFGGLSCARTGPDGLGEPLQKFQTDLWPS